MAEELLQARSRDVPTSDAQHTQPVALEPGRPSAVVLRLRRPIVNSAVDLEHQSLLRAVEVDDEPLERMLASELESEHPSVAQQPPRGPFSRGGMRSEVAGVLDHTALDGIVSRPHAGDDTARRELDDTIS